MYCSIITIALGGHLIPLTLAEIAVAHIIDWTQSRLVGDILKRESFGHVNGFDMLKMKGVHLWFLSTMETVGQRVHFNHSFFTD